MTTICLGFFDCCLPIDLGEKANTTETQTSPQTMKSKHETYWDKKCDTSPASPGCKIYELKRASLIGVFKTKIWLSK